MGYRTTQTKAGAKMVFKDTESLVLEVCDSVLPIFKEAAKQGVQRAKENVPVLTGALQKSIRGSATITKKKNKVTGYVKAGGKKARHALLVELGTVKMAAQPFLQPGRIQATQHIQRNIEGAVNRNGGGE